METQRDRFTVVIPKQKDATLPLAFTKDEWHEVQLKLNPQLTPAEFESIWNRLQQRIDKTKKPNPTRTFQASSTFKRMADVALS